MAGIIRSPLLIVILATLILPRTDNKDESWTGNQYATLLITNKNNNVKLGFIDSLNIILKDNPQKNIITIVYMLTVELATDNPYSKNRQEIFDVR